MASRIVVPKGATNRMQWNKGLGHYEAWFLTLNARKEGLGIWLRYTLDVPLQGPAYRELWAHVFDRAAPDKTIGIRQRFPLGGDLGAGDELFATPGGGLGERRARGRAEGGGHVVEWDLAFDSDPCSIWLAPYLLRKLKIAATSYVGANPDARLRGTVTIDGRTVPVEGEPGCQTHLWGPKHVEKWAWGHCNAFDGRDDCVLDGVAAYVKRFGRVTGPLTGLYVRYRGADYCLSALPRLFRTKSEVGFPTWRFDGAARDLRFVGTFRAAADHFVQVRYEDPDGEPSHCCNTEIADLTLEVFRGKKPLDRLTATGTAHLEFGDREPRTDVRATV